MYKDLNMKDDILKRELQYPISRYSPYTLNENWIEDRSQYKRSEYKHTSKYHDDFTPKTNPYPDKSEFWDSKFLNMGCNPIVFSKIGYENHPNYFENFTTTKDLSYNHFPKWCGKNIIERKYRAGKQQFLPTEEYLPPFHNLSNYGLMDYKKKQWCEAISDPRKTDLSLYKESYPKPDISYYKFPRWSKAPKSTSVSFIKLNDIKTQLRLRNMDPRPIIATPDDPIPYTKPKERNVITWECSPDVTKGKMRSDKEIN